MLPDLLPIQSVNNVNVVDSRLIANELDIQHKNLYQAIKDNQTDIEEAFGRVLWETETLNTAGGMQQVKFAYLNEDQATYLMTLSRNTVQVKKLKLKLASSARSPTLYFSTKKHPQNQCGMNRRPRLLHKSSN